MRRDKHGNDAFFHMASKRKIIIIIIIIIIITRNTYENLSEKSQFWGPNRRREDNIKIGLMSIVCVCVCVCVCAVCIQDNWDKNTGTVIYM